MRVDFKILIISVLSILTLCTNCSNRKKSPMLLLLGAASNPNTIVSDTNSSSTDFTNSSTTNQTNSSNNSSSPYSLIGVLDTSFGSNGIAAIASLSDDFYVHSGAIMSDGKILIVGQVNSDFALLRLNPDGSVDTSFGSGGLVTTHISGGDTARSVVATNSNILVAGSANSDQSFAIASYSPTNGSLINSFGTSGKAQPIINIYNARSDAVKLQSDGKILLAGTEYSDAPFYYNKITVARLNSNGSLDTSFGSSGKVNINHGHDGFGFSLSIQNDGKILVVGERYTASGSEFALTRLNSNGSLDNTFGSSGTAQHSASFFEGDYSRAQSVITQGDGKILVGGYTDSTPRKSVLVRYNSNGTVDTSFASSGISQPSIGSGNSETVSLAFEQTEKILAAGKALSSVTNQDFFIMRYATDGSIDTSFGTNNTGIVFVDVYGSSDNAEAKAILMQSDGKAVLVGQAYDGNYYRPVAIRIQ